MIIVNIPIVELPDNFFYWSNETVIEFLECYENEPVIWNASLPNHKNRNDVYNAWKGTEVKMGHYHKTLLQK